MGAVLAPNPTQFGIRRAPQEVELVAKAFEDRTVLMHASGLHFYIDRRSRTPQEGVVVKAILRLPRGEDIRFDEANAWEDLFPVCRVGIFAEVVETLGQMRPETFHEWMRAWSRARRANAEAQSQRVGEAHDATNASRWYLMQAGAAHQPFGWLNGRCLVVHTAQQRSVRYGLLYLGVETRQGLVVDVDSGMRVPAACDPRTWTHTDLQLVTGDSA